MAAAPGHPRSGRTAAPHRPRRPREVLRPRRTRRRRPAPPRALVERPVPEPAAGQVVIRVRAVALNFRDLLIARGHYPLPVKPELVPGSDAAGEVVAVGPGVTRFSEGDRVMPAFFETWETGPMRMSDHGSARGGAIDGVLAEYVAVDARALVRIPAHLSFEEAATLPCAGVTAWRALFESAPRHKTGDTVLCLGTGGVSVFAAQLALAAGLEVIMTSSSEKKLDRVRALGVRRTIDYRRDPDWERLVLDATGGDGVDHVVEVGGSGTIARSLAALKIGGTVSLIGALTGVDANIDPIAILAKSARVQGVFVAPRSSLDALSRAMEARELRPVVDRVFAFEAANEALAALAEQKHVGKLVVRVG
ncbi:MAG: NAD(P)-dependent alcohol dehydrogenase [Deltaproteobacteria bacterium]|nr:NAD(P)-dependent alcohol dehydrogenase [Deltaproteobacteria bacterium]